MFFTCQFLGDRYTTRSQIHIFVDVPNLFQLSALRRPVLNLHHGTIGKVNKNMNLFRLPNNKKSDSYFVDAPNVFHLFFRGGGRERERERERGRERERERERVSVLR